MQYSADDRALIWIAYAEQTSIKRRVCLARFCDTPAELYDTFTARIGQLTALTSPETVSRLSMLHSNQALDDIIGELEQRNIYAITLCDSRYSTSLATIALPPIVLFCRGELGLMSTRSIAVVGTRNVTRYGVDVTKKFVSEFARAGLTVVSGIARGVDTVAHRTALDSGGKTVAVLPCGQDKVYPAENLELYEIIADRGLLVSEYCLGVGVQQYTFPERNRIISGLSEGVFLPEAGEKSGSMITVNNALEQNREVYVVPGNIYSKTSMGCNSLLKELQGALVTQPEDVLKTMGIATEQSAPAAFQLDYSESLVINALSAGELHFEELVAKTNMSAKELNAVLLKLELYGIIKRLPGNYFEV